MKQGRGENSIDLCHTKTRRPAWADRTTRREFQSGLRDDIGL